MCKKFRLLFLFISIILTNKTSFAQGQKISLTQLLNLADSFKYNNPEEAIKYAQSGLKIANASSDKKNESKAYSLLGIILCIQGDYTESFKYHLKALKINEQLNDSVSMATNYNNIGMVLDNANKDSLALIYYLKAIQIQERKSKKKDLLKPYNNIGILYANLSQPNKAIYYFEKAAQIAHLTEQPVVEGSIKHNIAIFYIGQANYTEALELLNQSLNVHQQTNNTRGVATNYLYIGETYFYLKDDEKGLDYLNRSLNLAKEKGFKDILSECYLQVSMFYEGKKNFSQALNHIKLWAEVEKEIINEASVSSMAEMQTKYETEKKEKENLALTKKTEVQQLMIENENQKRKNQLTLSITLIGLIIAIFLFVYYRRKQKQKTIHAIELAEADKLRFKEVIEAEEKERARIAQELHDGLGQLLSTARLNVASLEDVVTEVDKPDLERSLKIIDEACVEVRNISHNMMPSALIRLGLIPAITELVNNVNSAKGIKIDFESNVDSSLGQSLDITIYRVVQEILNNMIKHAKANHINISIKKNDDDLAISMTDNGVGFNTNELEESKGLGWKNIFSRVSMLDGSIKLESELQKGTMVFINLKLKNGK
ncbi:MAG: sensor histidine kinase [Bacteroidetes bacterium]|nr:sensor histidine kinase [Bacteroidota bacterium]